MHRLYCPSQNISGGKITIDDRGQVHHARDVLRLKLNEEVIVFDDKGNEYSSILEKALPGSMVFDIKGRSKFLRNPKKVAITVACAIPKDSRMDEVIDKLTQLGVERIIPMETERVIVKLDKHKKELRLERWRKIALNASQQSQRNTLPILGPVRNIKELLSEAATFDLKLIPTLAGERRPLKEVLSGAKAKEILVMIGPEGDFTDAELETARKYGCIPVSLGDSVLRVDTAAIAAAAFIRLYHENC